MPRFNEELLPEGVTTRQMLEFYRDHPDYEEKLAAREAWEADPANWLPEPKPEGAALAATTLPSAPQVAAAVAQPVAPVTKPKAPPPTTTFDLDTMTMAEITLWDNWMSNNRPNTKGLGRNAPRVPFQRFAIQIKLWNEDPSTFSIHQERDRSLRLTGVEARTDLLVPERFLTGIANALAEQHIDQTYHDHMKAVHAATTATHLGMLRMKSGPKVMGYFPGCYAEMVLEGLNQPLIRLTFNGKTFDVPNCWTDADVNGNAFTSKDGRSKVLWQARIDLTETYGFAKWRTNNPTPRAED